MEFIDVAVTAARAAGKILMDGLGNLHASQIQAKSAFDFVTNIDHASEQLILGQLRAAYPTHSFKTEESGTFRNSSPYCWIIDPLDGTNNYIHSFPFFSVSIALEFKGELILGVIYDPLRDELFSAEKGQGAFLNDRRIEVTREHDLSRCMLATGFPFKDKELLCLYLQTFESIFGKVSGIRRAGSAALDLAYVACGRVDGFWEIKLHLWDIAAGVIILREAGGRMTDVSGGDDYLSTGNIIATNGFIHESISSIVRQVFKENP